MNKTITTAALFLTTAILCATSFQITGYLPSYRLESASRALGSEVLDLSGHNPNYESSREILPMNLEYGYDTLPSAYEYGSIESWYGRNVDRIIYFSVKPETDGSIDTSNIEERDISRLKNISHLYNTELILAVSGNSERFAPVAADEELRKKFVRELAVFCREQGFSGIDYDWEYPDTDEQLEHFNELIRETADLLSTIDMTVSAAVSRFRPMNEEVFGKLDSVNLMAYDNYGRHSTFESAVEAAEYLKIKYKVDPGKINLGIPFYGRIFSGLDPQYWTRTKIYRDIRDDYPITPTQDEAGGFYYNGMETVRKKTAYAIEQGLGGVMIWELGQDSLDEYSLLKAIREEIQ